MLSIKSLGMGERHVPLEQRARAEPSGLWGTVFTMCSATLGAGALSLPYALSQMGLALGLSLLVATAAATYYSIALLVAAMDATKLYSYEVWQILALDPSLHPHMWPVHCLI